MGRPSKSPHLMHNRFMSASDHSKHKPELMSPAGGWPQLRAAIEAGADAVYFGLDHFSARAKVGFSLNELGKIFDTLHERDVKGFVTFNTLVFDSELQQAEKTIAAIADAGADAIIVQDVGVAWLAGQIAPALEIHGSTQMSVTSAEGVELTRQFGCRRVVLGRELSLQDIKKITSSTDIETEVFVHGALCVSYSGQCFSSEAWGGRSANRGQCAQACRLSYELIVDDRPRDTGSDRYLLSPGDLYALNQIPDLIELGVACFKIEGRYKDENYVALTTRAYREAIDVAWKNKSVDNFESRKLELEQIYSRGLGPHFISGVNHQTVVKGRAPRHRGIKVGKVTLVDGDRICIQPEHEIFPGDGLVFDAADWRSPDEPEEGGNVFHVKGIGAGQIELSFRTNQIDFNRIRVGDFVWRTSHPKLVQLIKPLAKPTTVHQSRPIELQIEGHLDDHLKVTASSFSKVLNRNLIVSVKSRSKLQQARSQHLDTQVIKDQIGRLGGTPFYIAGFKCEVDQRLFLPVSELNEMRRAIVEQLKLQSRRPAITTNKNEVDRWLERQKERGSFTLSNTQVGLHLLVRSARQLPAAIECQPNSITLDYLELYGLRPSVEQIKSAGIVARVASPRILKPSEQKVIKFLLSLDCPIVVRSGGLLFELLKLPKDKKPKLIGDFSLNVANAVTAQLFLDRGLDVIVPTYDLNGKQIVDMTQTINPTQLEVISFSHLPVFHTEHCVFCRFLSDGTDNTNCGHPCEKHEIELLDAKGRRHPVMADVGCRNTVFGDEAQFSATHFSKWLECGIRNFRIEFVNETQTEVKNIFEAFQTGISQFETKGKLSVESLRKHVQRSSPSGITEGSLFVNKKTPAETGV